MEIVEKSFGTWAKGLSDLGIKEADKVYEEAKLIVDEKVKTVELYQNIKETLDQLVNKGKKLALHTSSTRNMLYPAIVSNDLEKYFRIILTRDDVKNGKPDPEVILKEMDFLNASPSECLIVGDSDGDMKTGKNAGVDTVLFYPESHKKFYRKEFLVNDNPDYVITDLLELVNLVN